MNSHDGPRAKSTNQSTGVAGVAHVASNVSFDPDPNIVIREVIASVHSILDSATKSSTVNVFVYTSSASALAPPTPGVVRQITDATFNDEDVQKAWAPPPYEPERAMSVYAASKVEAEKALFSYANEVKPRFAVRSIVLGVNFGKVLDWSIRASSGDFVKELFHGQTERAKKLTYRTLIPFSSPAPVSLPGILDEACLLLSWACQICLIVKVNIIPLSNDVLTKTIEWFVDVQDSARLHVAAFTYPTVKNERIIAYSEHYTWKQVNFAPRAFPEDISKSYLAK